MINPKTGMTPKQEEIATARMAYAFAMNRAARLPQMEMLKAVTVAADNLDAALAKAGAA